MSLKDELIAEYLKTKIKIKSHAIKNGGFLSAAKIEKHMTQKSMAGLYLKIADNNALKTFDMASEKFPGYAEKWSEARLLIAEALVEFAKDLNAIDTSSDNPDE